MKPLVTLAAAVVALGLTPLARADGDPASDWLLSQPSFVPEDIGVPAAYTTQLNAVLSDAKARGYEIRVAVIGTRYDMGSVYVDWLKPKRYVPFLSKELFFVYKGRVLVVMPNGLAVTDGGGKPAPAADRALVDRLPAPGKDPAALATAATHTVIALAANHGAIVALPKLGHVSGSTTNRDRVTLAAAALVVAALLGAGTFWRRRRTAATAA